MAPKLRRPAARGAAAKVAAAKAAPKAAVAKVAAAKARGRGGGVRIRRPAAHVGVAVKRKLADLSMEELGKLDKVVLTKALYYQREVDLSGGVKGCKMDGGQVFLEMEIQGTQDEELLKVMTGRPSKKLSVHVCDAHCGGDMTEEALVRGREFESLANWKEPWMTNLQGVVEVREEEDENQRLREAARHYEEEKGEDESPKAKEGKEGKKKKKKRKKKEDKEDGKSKKKKKKVEETSSDELDVGQRPLKDVFGGTGLDPSYKARSRILKKAKKLGQGKKKKKKKDSKSQGSGSSSSDSESSSSPFEEGGLFEEERKLNRLWTRYPGSLASSAVQEAKQKLVTAAGTSMAMDKKALPAIITQYSRQVVLPGVSAVMGQEILSISLAVDLLLSGKVAQCTDLLCQRLKALESLSRGNHWTVGRQHELVRIDQGGLADSAESRQAARLAREEDKLTGLVTRPYGGKPADGGKGAKKGKEPKGQAKGRADEPGKGRGDGKKDDQRERWQRKDK